MVRYIRVVISRNAPSLGSVRRENRHRSLPLCLCLVVPSQRLGRWLGFINLTPFTYWKNNHISHHTHLGMEGFRDTANTIFFTTTEYKNAPWPMRAVARVLRSPPVFFAAVPRTLLFPEAFALLADGNAVAKHKFCHKQQNLRDLTCFSGF